jgi:hypothetical protein
MDIFHASSLIQNQDFCFGRLAMVTGLKAELAVFHHQAFVHDASQAM